MMEGIKSYLLCICAAAILCSILRQVAGRLGVSGRIVSLLTSIFMVITLISPLLHFSLPDIRDYADDIDLQAKEYILRGQEMATEQTKQYISEQLQAYILEKASALNASVEVSIMLTDAQLPEPVGVRIVGSVSPYAKTVLSTYIDRQLGIPKEHQIWILS